MTEAGATAVPQAQGSTRPLGRLPWILLAGAAVSLALGVYANEPADEIKFVANGRSGMPAFDKSLSADDISVVVEYTRTL